MHQTKLRKEVKRQIKEGISEEELTLIKVTPENKMLLTWKHEHEFVYEGEMYDIVHTEIINKNTVVYHTLPDKKEHQLIANFMEKMKKRSQKNAPNNKYFKVLLKLPPQPFKQEAFTIEEHPKHVFNYTNLYHSILLDITSPPPKVV